jgi:hypothetical protein
MSRIIHARFDKATEKMLKDLQRRLGWSDSRVVREGIKTLCNQMALGRPRRIVGLGRFCSGVPDLGSNKDHLKGIGL